MGRGGTARGGGIKAGWSHTAEYPPRGPPSPAPSPTLRNGRVRGGEEGGVLRGAGVKGRGFQPRQTTFRSAPVGAGRAPPLQGRPLITPPPRRGGLIP